MDVKQSVERLLANIEERQTFEFEYAKRRSEMSLRHQSDYSEAKALLWRARFSKQIGLRREYTHHFVMYTTQPNLFIPLKTQYDDVRVDIIQVSDILDSHLPWALDGEIHQVTY